MSAKIISGTEISKKIKQELAQEVGLLKTKYDLTPGLAVVLVGENPASQVYVRMKEKGCELVGIYSEKHELPADITQDKLLELIDRLNRDEKIHGILVQLPLPGQINAEEVLEAISPDKDVDGFHPYNVGQLLVGKPGFVPCTPLGVIHMLKESGVDLVGKQAVVVGRSNIVGKPVALLLLQEHATVTVCHSRTKPLAEVTRRADVLVAAIGRPRMITADMVKPGAVVIDVGVNRLPDGKLCGDVDFEAVVQKAAAISPVPGGVGPMTIAMLLSNTVKSAKLHKGIGL
jgi:methylenetetrahydrofolate dehydrogenase (NADP+)/methenyltetrahydrofolate cyclohydrolase